MEKADEQQVSRKLLTKDDPVLEYLETWKRSGVSPSFFVSECFLRLKELDWVSRDDLFGPIEPGTAGWFLPPIWYGQVAFDGCGEDVWATCPGVGDRFLDYEFIYDPKRFLNLKGGEWSVFRKNVRKWRARQTGQVVYRELQCYEEIDAAANLVGRWAAGKTIHDPAAFVRLSIDGETRFGLFLDGVLVGLNVCDQNWEFTNFRLCVDDGSPFLQEYLRWLFYAHPTILDREQLVNDGGCLGSQGLKDFKMKLRPVEVRKLYSVIGVTECE